MKFAHQVFILIRVIQNYSLKNKDILLTNIIIVVLYYKYFSSEKIDFEIFSDLNVSSGFQMSGF